MILNKIQYVLVAVLFIFTAVSCDDDKNEDTQQWTLVWQDEFDTPTPDNRPDPTKWGYDIGTGESGWGNQELQYYTDRVENASLTTYEGNGCLKITAINESYGGASYTSARLNTKGIFDQTYGRLAQEQRRELHGMGFHG